MLRQRIITAVVLVAAFLVSLFASAQWVFTGFVGLLLLAAAWEWSALCGLESLPGRLLMPVASLLLAWWVASWSGLPAIGASAATETVANTLPMAGEVQQHFTLLLWMAVAYWALALGLVSTYPRSAVLWQSPWLRLVLGLLLILFAWSAMLVLRYHSHGQQLIIYIVLAVAAADIGAYFAGRRYGKTRLAKTVSPGKTREGVVGGVAAVLLFTLCFYFLVPLPPLNLYLFLTLALLIALVSVVGDLFESMLKRQVGIKDSGRILPGHGGVLDRVDGLVAAMPTFALAIMVMQW